MPIRVGIENGNEGRAMAWALDYPGCFAYGVYPPEALQNLPAALEAYNEWLSDHDLESLSIPPGEEVQVAETWEVYQIDDDFELAESGYEVNAWFQHDWKPPSEADVERSRQLLAATREDLLATVQGLDQELMEHKRPEERWSINGILNHVGAAEWWYLDRLGLAIPRNEVPKEPFERLEVMRAQLSQAIAQFPRSSQVVGIDGEFWSPRKVLRRAIWHERDHTFHIQKLLAS
jgi:predicted RNase H-like HicB family nuclease